jgi:hypothetical protein
VCEKQASAALREERSIYDFFRRNKRGYTTTEAAHVLAEAQNIRCSEDDASELINYFVKVGRLKRLKNPLWKNKLTVARTSTV